MTHPTHHARNSRATRRRTPLVERVQNWLAAGTVAVTLLKTIVELLLRWRAP